MSRLATQTEELFGQFSLDLARFAIPLVAAAGAASPVCIAMLAAMKNAVLGMEAGLTKEQIAEADLLVTEIETQQGATHIV